MDAEVDYLMCEVIEYRRLYVNEEDIEWDTLTRR